MEMITGACLLSLAAWFATWIYKDFFYKYYSKKIFKSKKYIEEHEIYDLLEEKYYAGCTSYRENRELALLRVKINSFIDKYKCEQNSNIAILTLGFTLFTSIYLSYRRVVDSSISLDALGKIYSDDICVVIFSILSIYAIRGAFRRIFVLNKLEYYITIDNAIKELDRFYKQPIQKSVIEMKKTRLIPSLNLYVFLIHLVQFQLLKSHL